MAHQIHVSSLSGQASACIRPVMREPLAMVPVIQFPFSCFLSAAGIGFLDLPVPAEELGFPCGRLTRHL